MSKKSHGWNVLNDSFIKRIKWREELLARFSKDRAGRAYKAELEEDLKDIKRDYERWKRGLPPVHSKKQIDGLYEYIDVVEAALESALFYATNKIVKATTRSEKDYLKSSVTWYRFQLQAGLAVEYTIKRIVENFKRYRKDKGPPKDEVVKRELLLKEEFLVSEVAILIGRTSRTVQNLIQNAGLKQDHPFAKIKKKDLLDFAESSKGFRFLKYDFDTALKEVRTSAIRKFYMNRNKL